MADGRITRDDLIEGGALRIYDDLANTAVKALDLITDSQKEYLKSLRDTRKELKDSSSLGELEASRQKQIKTNNLLLDAEKKRLLVEKQFQVAVQSKIKTEKDALSLLQKKETAQRRSIKLTAEERLEQQRARKNARQLAIISSTLSTEYERQSTRLIRLRNQYKGIAAEFGVNSREARKLQKQLRELDISLKRVDAAAGQFQRNVGNYPRILSGAAGSIKNLANAAGLLGGAFLAFQVLKDATQTVVEFDKQLIAVGKTTNISGPRLKELGNEVVALGLQLEGISGDNLLKTAEVAGQLGISAPRDILKFAETIEKLRLTSDLVGEEGARSLARFINVAGEANGSTDRLGSSVTELGNSYATTESAILATAEEVQRGVAVYNTQASAILGISAATSALGVTNENARSSIQLTFDVIDNAISTGEGLEEILRLTGLTQNKLSKQFKEDATGVFNLFIKGLNEAGKNGENLRNVLVGLDIQERRARATIGSLATNYETLNEAIESSNRAYDENIALTNEANASAESLSAKVNDIEDAYDAFILSLEDGQGPLANTFKFLADQIEVILKGLRQLAQTNQQNEDELFNVREARSYADALSEINSEVLRTGRTEKEVAQETISSSVDRLNFYDDELFALKERRKELEEQKDQTSIFNTVQLSGISNELDQVNDSITDAQAGFALYSGIVRASEEVLDKYSKTTEDSSKNIEEESKEIDENNRKRRDTQTILNNTVGFFEKQISTLKKNQKNLADNSDEYQVFNEKIAEAEFQIDNLKNAISELSDSSESFEFGDLLSADEEQSLIDQEVSDIEAGLEALSAFTGDSVQDLRRAFETFYEGDYESFLDFSNRKIQLAEEETEKLKEEAEKRKQFALQVLQISSDSIQAVGDIVSASFDRRISLIDDELEANERSTETRLENFRGTEEQRQNIEDASEKKRKALEEEKRKEQLRQARFEKAINISKAIADTASAVVEALPNIPLSILAGALGAAQIGIIASQRIPQYAKGKDRRDTYTGKMIFGEVPGNTEIQTDEQGNIKAIASQRTEGYTEAGDTIYPNLEAYKKSQDYNYDDIIKATQMATIRNAVAPKEDPLKNFDKHIEKLSKDVNRSIKKGFTGVQIINQITSNKYERRSKRN